MMTTHQPSIITNNKTDQQIFFNGALRINHISYLEIHSCSIQQNKRLHQAYNLSAAVPSLDKQIPFLLPTAALCRIKILAKSLLMLDPSLQKHISINFRARQGIMLWLVLNTTKKSAATQKSPQSYLKSHLKAGKLIKFTPSNQATLISVGLWCGGEISSAPVSRQPQGHAKKLHSRMDHQGEKHR